MADESRLVDPLTEAVVNDLCGTVSKLQGDFTKLINDAYDEWEDTAHDWDGYAASFRDFLISRFSK